MVLAKVETIKRNLIVIALLHKPIFKGLFNRGLGS